MRDLSLILALFVSLLSTSSRAARTTEGAAELTEKAHNLTLQKDRTQAVNILVTAIHREPPGSSNAKELKMALQDVSGLFIGDKAQQLFELAISLRRTDAGQAQNKLNEALRIEPDNLQLLNEAARLQMSRGECAAATEALAKHRKWNPYDEQTLLSSAQAAVCQGDWPSYTALRSQAEARKGPYAKYWLSMEVERAAREKADSRLHDSLEALKKEDPQYPEAFYWEWKTAKEPSVRSSAGQKYLSLCKNISAAPFRKLMMEPFLCKRTDEVETFVKGSS